MPAVVLLVEPVRLERVKGHDVRVVTDLGVFVGQEGGGDPAVERAPRRPAVEALEGAAPGEADIEMLRVARVHQDRVRHRAVRRVLSDRADARHQIAVEALDTAPGDAAVLGAEEPVR